MSTAPARPALCLDERRTSPPARRPSRSTPCAARPEACDPRRLISRTAIEGNPSTTTSTTEEDRMNSQLNQAGTGWIVTMRAGAQEQDFQVEAICAFVD